MSEFWNQPEYIRNAESSDLWYGYKYLCNVFIIRLDVRIYCLCSSTLNYNFNYCLGLFTTQRNEDLWFTFFGIRKSDK